MIWKVNSDSLKTYNTRGCKQFFHLTQIMQSLPKDGFWLDYAFGNQAHAYVNDYVQS